MTLRRRNTILAVVGVASTTVLVASLGALTLPRLDALTETQASEPPPPQFDVASVKPNKSGDGRVMLGMMPGGRFNATNVPLRLLIRNAYQLQDFQILDAPSWIASERFDVAAKAEGDPPPPQFQLMMRALLADRFGLVAHLDTREMPIYALVIARPDGKLGPKLTSSATDCAALLGRGRGAAPPPPPAPGAPMTCGMRFGPGSLTAGGMALSQLATSLAQMAGRVVHDKTGLSGQFDFDLSWTPDQGAGPGGAQRDAPVQAAGDNGVSLFTAIQEQLGLKLDSQRGQVDVLVIDKVEMPKPD